jgi:hypothetical protein
LLTGCSKDNKISSVYIKDYSEGAVIEMPVGKFDFSAYTLVVAYESGETNEITLTEEMIQEADLFKFYQAGEHDITVTYGKHKCIFRVSVKRSVFGELTLPKDNVFTYDGEAHTVEVQGDMPANAVVTYPGGNSFINAGTYDVVAIVSCEGYVTERLSTTVKIERAKHDMSSITFEGKELVYDGKAHSLSISGTLPKGVSSPTYYINEKVTSSATDVGEYVVTARFANKDPNYEPIPDMVATLKIAPAEYSVSGVEVVFKDADGSIISDNAKIYDGTSVSFEISGYDKISNRISIAYSVYDAEGKKISTSNRITGITNAGIYTVKVEFILADSKNYKPVDPVIREFEVEKADYNLNSDVYLDSDTLEYDGAPHSLEIDGNLPAGVSVSYEYYLDDTLLLDSYGSPVKAVTDVGRYTVKAIFSHGDSNYKDITPITASLYIAQATLDVNGITSGYVERYTYDGTGKKLEIVILDPIPDGVVIRYEYYLDGQLLTDSDGAPVTSVTEVGVYTVKVIFDITNPNYSYVAEMTVGVIIEAIN